MGQRHRQCLLVNGGILSAAILIAVVSVVVYNSRSEAASVAFGAAMQAYQTPLAQSGQAVPPGMTTYSSAAERAKAAGTLFQAVADKYGMTPDGPTRATSPASPTSRRARTSRPKRR